MSNPDPRGLWQAQPTERTRFTVQEIAAKAARLEGRVSRRNRREYVGSAVVVIVFGAYLFLFPNPLMRAGSVLTILAAAFISWHLHRNGTPSMAPEEVGQVTSLDAYRRELVKQRDLLRGVWLWYIAPFLPGFALFSAGTAKRVGWGFLGTMAFCLLVFAVVGYLNHRAARRLQREIEQLDEMEKSL
jgi:hypothetical protein